MTDHEAEIDSTQIPTSEILKRQRKAAYQKAKDQRHAAKLENKAEIATEKALARQKRDKELWDALAPASKINAQNQLK